MSIEQLLTDLAGYSGSETVSNPYRSQHALQNLRLYLEYLIKKDGKRILLVGEAPGYKGCAITGIPFTSGKIFRRFEHPLLVELRDDIRLPCVKGEISATIVWEYLTAKGCTPLFWNSFPFHPHDLGNVDSNRRPSDAEVELGVKFLKQLSEIYQPDVIAAIGYRGKQGVTLAFPGSDIAYIRHPSNGGKAKFINDMNAVI